MSDLHAINPDLQSHMQYGHYDMHAFANEFNFRQSDSLYPAQAGPSAGAYMEYFNDPPNTSASAFPGLFYTNFDEQNPLPGFGVDDLMREYVEGEQTPPHFGHT